MKKDELLSIGLTEEQANQVFAMNGKDVEKAKSEVSTLKTQLAEAQNTIKTLEANKGDLEGLQAELDKYKQAEAERQQAEQEAQARAATLERFKAAKGDKEFSSEYAESGVLEAFSKALDDPANTGKGDAELFTALTQDAVGLFKNPQQETVTIKSVGGSWSNNANNDAMMRRVMGLPPTKGD